MEMARQLLKTCTHAAFIVFITGCFIFIVCLAMDEQTGKKMEVHEDDVRKDAVGETNIPEQHQQKCHKDEPEQGCSDPYDYDELLAIPADKYDMMLADINDEVLAKIGGLKGIVNLSPAAFPAQQPFPVEGLIYGPNMRLMVCLPCRRVYKPAETVNVWFVIDTGSGYNYLAPKTVKALIQDEAPVPKALRVSVQDPASQIEFHISPLEKHFAEANVLGIDALQQLKLSIDIDWTNKEFKLVKQ